MYYVPNMYVTSPLFITRLLLMLAIFARIVYYVVTIPCRSHSECVGIPTSNKCLGSISLQNDMFLAYEMMKG